MSNILWPSGDPIQSAFAISAGTTIPAAQVGRALRVTAGSAGTIVVTLPDGTTDTLTLATGDNIYPYAIVSFANGSITPTNAAILR